MAIKNRVKEFQKEKNKMIEEGIHPKIADRKIDTETNREKNWVLGSVASLLDSIKEKMKQTEEIISSYTDPRDFYNELINFQESRVLLGTSK